MNTVLTARAHAKLNLCLAVAPPEPSGSPRAGWHRIASWFAPIELWDELSIRAAPASTYTRRWAPDAPRPSPIDWPEDKDLAVRAHRLLEHHAGAPLPIDLDLCKRIPTGGGLGGGSSDAAAVLRAVTRLYNLPLTPAALRALSARLGSDIAYFIPDEPDTDLLAPPPAALVSGFGDSITPAAAPRGPLTLILPDFGCPTPAVYKAFDALPSRHFRAREVARLADPARPAPADPGSLSGALFNDLLDPAAALAPDLLHIVDQLRARGHAPHLSGSGSTLFILGSAAVTPPAGCTLVRTRFAASPSPN